MSRQQRRKHKPAPQVDVSAFPETFLPTVAEAADVALQESRLEDTLLRELGL